MGKIAIATERCKGCHLCISVCPKQLLSVSAAYNQSGYAPVCIADMESCTGCGLCAEMCPDICITVWRKKKAATG